MPVGKPPSATEPPTSDPEKTYQFGPYTLHTPRHMLFKDGEPVHLGSRALLLLVVLVSRAGELLKKEELLALIWPKVIVEECNLRAQVKALRRTLEGQGEMTYIETRSGRGYSFIAPVVVHMAPPVSTPDSRPTMRGDSVIPHAISTMIGRDEPLQALDAQLQAAPWVTITGGAGVGKSTVAMALARQVSSRFTHGVSYFDLASSDEALPSGAALARAAGAREDARHLLVLDNCDRRVREAVTMAHDFLRHSPHCRVLATSRGALHGDAEQVYALASLEVPADDPELFSCEALECSAIELFIERANDNDPDFVFRDVDARAVAKLCRKLDGNALAIEIAALRVRTFGIAQLLELLDDTFRLQMAGRRNAAPRHRSLSAALDWTYVMLADDEQALLRQLAVFTEVFDLESVSLRIAARTLKGQDPALLLERLVEQSLLLPVTRGPDKRYRLPETTRLFAAQKLAEHLVHQVLA